MNFYNIMGLEPGASEEEIKRAFRKKASENHPDRGGDSRMMAVINKAHDTLSDPERRKRYDETGIEDERPPIEKQAQEWLFRVFTALIDESPADMKKAAFKVLDGVTSQVNGRQAALAMAGSRLAKARGKVKAKEGPNLFEQLLDTRDRDLKEKIREAMEARTILNLAREMLDNYEFPEPEREQSYYYNTSATTI